jgi:multidrug efflux system outer membrane protein
VATLRRQLAQAGNALNLLVGGPAGNLPPPQTLSGQNIVTDLPPGAPSDLLTRRPDIRAAEQRLMAANANIGAARAAFFPRISLTSTIGTVSPELSGLFEAGSRVWSFAPQLTLPIFDWGRNANNLDLARVRSDIAVVAYEQSIQNAFREVADALVARDALDEQVAAQQRYRDAVADRLMLSEARYAGGVDSFLGVLDAQRELFTADQALLQVRQLRLLNAVDLYRALGGGVGPEGGVAGRR